VGRQGLWGGGGGGGEEGDSEGNYPVKDGGGTGRDQGGPGSAGFDTGPSKLQGRSPLSKSYAKVLFERL
jgi:hypothetical protein